MMPTCSRLRKHTTLLCLSVSSFDRSFRMSFCDFLSLLSTDSDSTRQQIPHVIVIFQRRMQPVSHNINEFLAELWTHVSCFDQINFMNRVGMPFVTNVRNDLWFPTFVIKYCFVFFFEDERPRSHRLVCLLSCLLLLQSVKSTEFCRGTAGNLNHK